MTTPSRRLFLAAGSAGAVFGALSAAARPSDLESLIEAHRCALAAFHDAIDAEDAAETALRAAHPDGLHVPDGLGGSFDGLIHDSDEIKERIAAAFDPKRQELASIETIAPGSTAVSVATLMAKEAETLAKVDAIFERECGALAAAGKKRRAASEMEAAAVHAICSYPSATIEEARRKAAYVAAIPSIDDFGDGHVLAFIRSFARSDGALS